MPSSKLDPEPFSCYAVVTSTPELPFDEQKWERKQIHRHAQCHEGDVHFNPRPAYEQDADKYPSEIWSDD